MIVDVFRTPDEFSKLEDNWNRVYEADPDAQAFLSWDWLSVWLPLIGSEWLVFAARPSSSDDFVAFFPVRIRTQLARDGVCFSEIAMAGNRFADYTGLICRPERDRTAIPALAETLKTRNWAMVHFEGLYISQSRMRLLLSRFGETEFYRLGLASIDPETKIDHTVCPYVKLPESWDDYLNGLSSNSRQKLRRILRKVEASQQLVIEHASRSSIDQDIDALLNFWCARWRSSKQDKTDRIANNLRITIRRCFDTGQLLLPVLKYEGRTVGANAYLIDHRKKSKLFLVTGRDPHFCAPEPGLALHAHSIRHAIESGLRTYDFLRGNEPYKYKFGAQDRRICSYVVRLKNPSDMTCVLDELSIPDVLAHAQKLADAGELRKSEVLLRQVLALRPSHRPAAFRYAHVKLAQGDAKRAEPVYRQLVEALPNSDSAWLGLGYACAMQDNQKNAIAAFNSAVSVNPRSVPAHFNLGVALERNGDWEGAARCYRKVMDWQPEYQNVGKCLERLAKSA